MYAVLAFAPDYKFNASASKKREGTGRVRMELGEWMG